MNTNDVTIIIPAYNEEQGIGPVVEGLREAFPDVEVIVIDDCSRDKTGEIAEAAGARVVRHPENCGYGAGLKTGIRTAKTPYVLSCDADGQHRIEDVQKVIDTCTGHDMIVGARGDDSHVPLTRAPGKKVLSWFANTLTGRKIPDINSGLRIFKRKTILRYLHLMPDGFSFSTTSTIAMMKTRRLVEYVPIKVEQRVGTSTVKQLRDGPRTLMLILRLTVLFEPLKVFMNVAKWMGALAFLSLLADLIFGEGGIGDTTALLAVATLLIFMFGLLCDQVSALRREQHESPEED